jgi:flagellar biosynthesis protein FlhF
MNVKRIVAKTSREAMRQLRDELGPDAIILANRQIEGGVEILALPPEDMASLAPAAFESRPPVIEEKPLAEATPVVAVRSATAPVSLDDTALAQSVIAEIRSMQNRLEMQMSELVWRDLPGRNPAQALVMREMLAAGFSAHLAKQVIERLPADGGEGTLTLAKASLMKALHVINGENEMLESGGIFALMGPTGSGKTTTTAKLAARFVVRHGAEKLALLTTDSYRIGGHEQLRIYGKILGVSVHAVRDAADLRIALSELRNKHTVLIDTVGMSQRDQALAEQVEMLCQAGKPIKRLLLLNATSHGETLNEVVQAYQQKGLDGCILSKIDEAASLGPAIDCAIRHRLMVHYVSTGQRVPEDLHVANRQYLIDRAFRNRPESSPYRLEDADLPYVLADMTSNHTRESAVAFG